MKSTIDRTTRLLLVAGLAGALGIALALFRSREAVYKARVSARSETANARLPTTASMHRQRGDPLPSEATTNPSGLCAAQETVARRFAAIVSDRRAVVHRIAQRRGILPPPVIERFFAAAAASRWCELDLLAESVSAALSGQDEPEGGDTMFAPVFETYCIANLVQTWPADELVGLGRAMLEASGSAEVLVSNTATGLWLATLANDASGPNRKIVIAQSLLADPAYASYLWFLYPERLAPLSSQDLSRAHQAHAMRAASEPPSANLDADINRELMFMLLNMNPQLGFAWEGPPPADNLYP